MGSSLLLFGFLSMLLKLIVLFNPLVTHCFTSLQPSCRDHERSALLQFKRSIVIDKSSCRYEGDYPKPLSWEHEGDSSSNCCSWDGVECDEKTGHVIGLDLNSACLYGSVDSNSTLFHLVHLQKLDLAYNNFNFSPIPTAIGQLSEMRYLSLSSSFFFGQVPYEISRLSKLSYLDLSSNFEEDTGERFLKLVNPNMRSLVQNLTRLESLFLDNIHWDMTSLVPDLMSNLSSLTQLSLRDCGLHGPIPSSLGKLTQLSYLDLGSNVLSGYIPSSFQNLTLLTDLELFENQITGPIPSWLGNLTELTTIAFEDNKLHGPIPQTLSELQNLKILDLRNNSFAGTMKFDLFSKMRHLTYLNLGQNKFSVLFGEGNINSTLQKFKSLTLSSCNLSEFPNFLRHQNKLEILELASNSIPGQLPKWILNSSAETLILVDVSNNFLTGFQHLSTPTILPWVRLEVLDLHSNMLQGHLPIPPSSAEHYDVSNNMLSGEISPLICNLTSVFVLDLSSNNFSGMIPPCLGNFSDSLLVLNLRNNSFHGLVPHLACKDSHILRMIDFSHNRLQGQLPPSLATCMTLEYLDFSNNQLFDIFPTWLGICPNLEVLIMRKNGFYGVIGKPNNTLEFQNLRIIDLSHNNFTGELPNGYIFNWNAIKSSKTSNLTYQAKVVVNRGDLSDDYYYSLRIMVKSVETYYEKIQKELAVIDLSSNKFSGEIPAFVGNLTALYSLNLSNNMLVGRIPSSLGNLSQLESLDISHNKLSGEIPQQLVQLTFLQSLDVSHNNLTGPIPQGNQFYTFGNNSFEDNPGLCGEPLSRKCDNFEALPPPPLATDQEEDDDSWCPIELDWKFVLMGYISGLVVGVSIGDMVMMMAKRQEWLVRLRKNKYDRQYRT
ncbi:Leucine-rich repeat domain containing protein [Trema orientale]|uniref:Leucine-rich repeat domain containing protein n=1 Tax=Trema orientale TaxID=63057 RepID=A0A2P5DA80_TREOI|nr:Leucine-rich repeat domain containing protein [Trema orientale]